MKILIIQNVANNWCITLMCYNQITEESHQHCIQISISVEMLDIFIELEIDHWFLCSRGTRRNHKTCRWTLFKVGVHRSVLNKEQGTFEMLKNHAKSHEQFMYDIISSVKANAKKSVKKWFIFNFIIRWRTNFSKKSNKNKNNYLKKIWTFFSAKLFIDQRKIIQFEHNRPVFELWL